MGDAGFGTLGCGTENSVFQQPSGYSEVELNTDHLNSLTSAVFLAYGLGKMAQLESTCCLWMRTWVQSHIKSCSMILESHHWGGRQEDPWRLLATYCSAIDKLHVQWGTSSQKLGWKETTTHTDFVTELPLYSILSAWLGARAGSKDISVCCLEPRTSHEQSVWITAVTSGNCRAWLTPVPPTENK